MLALLQNIHGSSLIVVLFLLSYCELIAASCESGEITQYKYFQDGEKSAFPVNKTIVFQQAFDTKPAFMYGVTYLDSNYAENNRFRVKLLEISRNHAMLSLMAMHDTKIYGLGVSWMACS